MSNQRVFPRYLLKTPVVCHKDRFSTGNVIDISSQGFQLITKSAGEINQNVFVRIPFFSPLEIIENVAECVWRKYDKQLNVFLCGYRFVTGLNEQDLYQSIQYQERFA